MIRHALRSLPARAIALASIALLPLHLRAQSVIDLGINAYGEPTSSTANAINPDGSFAVGTHTFPTLSRAFRWTLTGGNIDLSCGYNSGANGLANVSIVAGFANVTAGPIPTAARWLPSYCPSVLSPNPPGLLRSAAFAIDLNANLIVGSDTFNNPFVGDYDRPWQWTPTGGFQPLPIPLIYGAAGVARAISSNGLVIVGDSGSQDYIPGYLSQPCYWIGGVQTQLGLMTPSSSRAQATATNANGTVIVGGGDIAVSGFPFPSSGPWHAFRWQGGYADLGLLPNAPANGYTYARAVSEDGSVVVGHGTDNTGQHAFIWREDFGMIRLDTLLNFLGVNTAGWTFREANDISTNDRALCGAGVKDGLARAYVVRDLPRLCGPSRHWSGRARHQRLPGRERLPLDHRLLGFSPPVVCVAQARRRPPTSL
jgi:probable HAF family extracellular repeat protein